MATKNRGISPELLIHPGETIQDIICERSISQKELAQRSGVSEAFLSDVIHGKKDISKGLAMGLEYALGVPSSFWLNLQANYDAELLSINEENSVDSDELCVLEDLHDIVTYLRNMSLISKGASKEQTAIELRRLFQVSKLTSLNYLVPHGSYGISDNTNSNVLGAWLCLCKIRGAGNKVNARFDAGRINELVSGIKSIMNDDHDNPKDLLIELFAEHGIDFSVVRDFNEVPARCFVVCKEDSTYQMVLTATEDNADAFWFSLFHELGHLVNGDYKKKANYIDSFRVDSKPDKDADVFAKQALIDQKSYEEFLASGSFTYKSISSFALSQHVPPYIVIERLQMDNVIPEDSLSEYIPVLDLAE